MIWFFQRKSASIFSNHQFEQRKRTLHQRWNCSNWSWILKSFNAKTENECAKDAAERTENVNFFQTHSRKWTNEQFSLMTSADHQMIQSKENDDISKTSCQNNPSTLYSLFFLWKILLSGRLQNFHHEKMMNANWLHSLDKLDVKLHFKNLCWLTADKTSWKL